MVPFKLKLVVSLALASRSGAFVMTGGRGSRVIGRGACRMVHEDPAAAAQQLTTSTAATSTSTTWSRRQLLQTGIASAGVLSSSPLAGWAAPAAGVGIRGADPNGPPYQLPALPFAVDALEPFMAAECTCVRGDGSNTNQ